jgi:glycerophosphoryl diester phosphodiesterase
MKHLHFFSLKTIFLYSFLGIFALSVYANQNFGDNTTMKSRPFLIIAHRGVSSEAPENTMKAFNRAKDMHLTGIECDIRITKDLVPIVIHDNNFNRLNPHVVNKNIENMNLSDIKKIDIGSWFDKGFEQERVPTLNELLRADLGPIMLNLEVKVEDNASDNEIEIVVDKILDTINSTAHLYPEKELVIGSFSHKIIQAFQKRDPSLNLAGIVEKESELMNHLSLGVKILSLHHSLITPKLAQSLKNAGISIWAWTVDDIEKSKELLSYGVEGIITDHPYNLKEHLELEAF